MVYDVKLLDEAVDFINKQPAKMKAKIDRAINLLEWYGHRLLAPHSKRIVAAGGLYELRVKVGSDICRLFYFHLEGRIYVVTSGYVKKSRKLDTSQLSRAKALMKKVREQLK